MIAGENLIARITMYESDGETPILLSDFSLIRAEVINAGRTQGPFVYGIDPEVRQGATTSQIEFELTKAVSNKLRYGTVQLKITTERTNAEFEVDNDKQREIYIEDIAEINGETESEIELSLSATYNPSGEIPIVDFNEELQFGRDQEHAFTEGGDLSFTLASSGNLNGVGIILKLNTPNSVTFSADFEAMPNSQDFDDTKMNLTTLVYFSDFDGAGNEKVLYNNIQLTAI